MAKLLPMLTAAAMIGVIGGVLLWLIVSRGDSVVLESSPPATPANSVQADSGASRGGPNSGSAATKTAPTHSAEETPNPSLQIGAVPAPARSSSISPPAAPVQMATLTHPGGARGTSTVSLPLGQSPRPAATGGIDDALSFALEAADPYEKEGFTVREDYWGGDLPAKQPKAIVQQLYKGNSYWFWMGTNQDGAKIAVHIYDSSGHLAEAESWQKPHKAAAMVVPKKTGTYYVRVEVERSPAERTSWALSYGFR